MPMEKHVYVAIDLKSFYASAECVERGLDPLTTNLVVADVSRSGKTICLAVSPSLKSYGIPGRPRLFEVQQKTKEINRQRLMNAPEGRFLDTSYNEEELKKNPNLMLDYIAACPRMQYYIDVSASIYEIYLKYVSAEDVHVYSIDEVFIDATKYLTYYGKTPREFTEMLIKDVLRTTGITATAGIAENMFLCKVAMDIVAKHAPADVNGVRIAELNEMAYRKLLWTHEPLTDFWRVGAGTQRKLNANGIFTMGDIARCSLENEGLLYSLFGVNAELLIDHAWGWESCTIADIHAYTPKNHSLSSSQILSKGYDHEKAKVVVKEMCEQMSLDLVEKNLVTDTISLYIGYDAEGAENYAGEVVYDHYGRKMPKGVHGAFRMKTRNSRTSEMCNGIEKVYDQITDPSLKIRRIGIAAVDVIGCEENKKRFSGEQMSLFEVYDPVKEEKEEIALEKERKAQLAMNAIRKKFGKNAVMKGRDLEEGATQIERNSQIGGHKA